MRGAEAGRGGRSLTGNHLPRLYVAAGTIVVFFVLWATVAAHPWTTTSQATPEDPRLLALGRREKALRVRAVTVKHVVDRRWTAYEKRLRRRQWDNEVALQRHLRELEASQAAALRAARAYQAQARQAQAYASRVVAWANAQVASTGTSTSATTPVATRTAAPAAGAARSRKGPSRGRKAERGFRGCRPPGGPGRGAAPTPEPAPAAAPAPTPRRPHRHRPRGTAAPTRLRLPRLRPSRS